MATLLFFFKADGVDSGAGDGGCTTGQGSNFATLPTWCPGAFDPSYPPGTPPLNHAIATCTFLKWYHPWRAIAHGLSICLNSPFAGSCLIQTRNLPFDLPLSYPGTLKQEKVSLLYETEIYILYIQRGESPNGFLNLSLKKQGYFSSPFSPFSPD